MAGVIQFPGSSNLRCSCSGEWFTTPGVTISAETGSPTGYALPLTCIDCGKEATQ